jgi:hypothetical protein
MSKLNDGTVQPPYHADEETCYHLREFAAEVNASAAGRFPASGYAPLAAGENNRAQPTEEKE